MLSDFSLAVDDTCYYECYLGVVAFHASRYFIDCKLNYLPDAAPVIVADDML